MYEGQLGAWLVTLGVEAAVAAALARQFAIAPWKAAAAAFFGSLITHPIVWWTYFHVIATLGYWPTFALVEGFAVTAEAVLYRAAGASWGPALSISFVVNAASVLAGFALQSLGWI